MKNILSLMLCMTMLFVVLRSEAAADDHSDSCATATAIAVNQSNVAGVFESGGDEDFFVINATSPGILTVNSTGTTDTKAYLYADCAAGELAFDDDSGADNNFNIVYTLPSAGNYYLRVLGYSIFTTGAYSVNTSFEALPETRILTVDSSPRGWLILESATTDNNSQSTGSATPFTRAYYNATSVTLVANSSMAGADFLSWSGCGSASDTTCNVTMDADKTVTALYSTIALSSALDSAGLSILNGGSAQWYGQNSVSHDGVDAAQSGYIEDYMSSSMQTSYTGPGLLTFWWKVSSEPFFDYLSFFIDDVEQSGAISGEEGWEQQSHIIPSGSHTVRWSYEKDSGQSAGADAGWVDQVVYSLQYPLTLTRQGHGSGTVVATVSNSPAGIDCGSTCSALYNAAAEVTLTVTADSDSLFTGWAGDCSGSSATCTLTMSAAHNVTALFKTQTRFHPDYELAYSTKIGTPIRLEAQLEENRILPYYLDIANAPVHFQIYVNSAWQNIPDDGISLSSLNTDADGMASVYYLPAEDTALGMYQLRQVYDGDASYGAAVSGNSTVEITGGTCKVVDINAVVNSIACDDHSDWESTLVHEHTVGTGIPLILVHGNSSDKSTATLYRWQYFLNYITNTSAIAFGEFDIYVWRHDTSKPIGFNGYTGNAVEFAGYMNNYLLPQYPAQTKPIIIAHSRGGLVSRSYMNYSNQGDNVLGLITLGTPHHGSPGAVPDWSAAIWALQLGTDITMTSLFDTLVTIDNSAKGFDYDRLGSINLAWDNMDASLESFTVDFDVALAVNGQVHLTARDTNSIGNYPDPSIMLSDTYKQVYGDLTWLNQHESYFDRIVTFGAYDDNIANNPLWSDFESIVQNLSVSYIADHTSLAMLTKLMAYMADTIVVNEATFTANDGMVPLQSALFLNTTGGLAFSSLSAGDDVVLNSANMTARQQVKSQHIFSGQHDNIRDHLDLLDTTNKNYWDAVTAEVRGFLRDAGLPFDVTAPAGSLTINNSAAATNSTAVTLSLSCSDAGASGCVNMKFSNDDSVWSEPEAFSSTKAWSVAAGEGMRTVYVRYQDGSGNWSGSLSDTIIVGSHRVSGTVNGPAGSMQGVQMMLKHPGGSVLFAQTDETGAYAFEYMSAGDYKLGARVSGCSMAVEFLTVSGSDVVKDIKMDCP